jgi:hypothetical protein
MNSQIDSNAVETIKQTGANDQKIVILNSHISAVTGTSSIDIENKIQGLGINISGRKLLNVPLFEDDFMKKYEALRRQAVSLIETKGGKCELGYVYRRKTVQKQIDKLNGIKAVWYDYKKEDAPLYDAMTLRVAERERSKSVSQGATQVQADKLFDIIRGSQPEWSKLEDRLQFDFTLIEISLNTEDFDADLYEAQSSGVALIRESVMGNLIADVCKQANSIVNSMAKREATHTGKHPICVNNRTTTAVYEITEKLDELTFIHKNIGVVSEEIKRYLVKLPAGKALRFHNYDNFKALIGSLTDQVDLMEKLADSKPLIEIKFKESIDDPLFPEDSTNSSNSNEAEDVTETEADSTLAVVNPVVEVETTPANESKGVMSKDDLLMLL